MSTGKSVRVVWAAFVVVFCGGCHTPSSQERSLSTVTPSTKKGGETQAQRSAGSGSLFSSGSLSDAQPPTETQKEAPHGASILPSSSPVAAGIQVQATPARPAPTTHVAVGKKLVGLQAVNVSELVNNPSAYKGKNIRVEGKVVSYCFHARNWFAIKQDDGPALRILTTPGFLVPENAMDAYASAEGTVDVIEVSATSARHYAESHGLADPRTVTGSHPVKQVIVRAWGAEFVWKRPPTGPQGGR